MDVLALEPYHGGSHQAFLDGWTQHSRHRWTVLGLPAFKWKWRMRHAPITFADQLARRVDNGETWHALVCSDMLNLAEFLGLAPAAVRQLPAVAYFHENQLTYPYRFEDQRDYQYCFSNMATALAADAVWFNSAFHRDEFLHAIPTFLKQMPDHQPWDLADRVRPNASVQPPGIAQAVPRSARPPGPMRILWAARWEFDKDPDTFFEAARRLDRRGIDFRLSVIGQQFRDTPACFAQAEKQLARHIDRWGYQQRPEDYHAALAEADVVLSTAQHEFFGIGIIEAVAAGCYPVAPHRLAYPETLGELAAQGGACLYHGGADELADRLAELAARVRAGDLWHGAPDRGVNAMAKYVWDRRAPEMDDALEQVAG